MDARQQIRQHLDRLFEDAPNTRASWELQEELFSNCMERYMDLTAGGMDSQEAVNTVLGSIGDVDELIAALPGEQTYEPHHQYYDPDVEAEMRRRSAVVTAVAIGLYIFAGVMLFAGLLFGNLFNENMIFVGFILAGLICIIPTVMLVYNANRFPKYKKQDDTVVENFKQWNTDSKKTKSLRAAISSVIWTLTVVVYLLVSFLTFAWAITWIIFPIAACLEALVTLMFRLKEM